MGSGVWVPAMATRPAERKNRELVLGFVSSFGDDGWALINESDQAGRAISTGKLHALLHVHTRPIDVVVFHGSDRENWF